MKSPKLVQLLHLIWSNPIFNDAYPAHLATHPDTVLQQIETLYAHLVTTLGPTLARGLPLAAPATILATVHAVAPKATAFCPAIAAGETTNLHQLQAVTSSVALAYCVDQCLDTNDQAMHTAIDIYTPGAARQPLIFPSPMAGPIKARLTLLQEIDRHIQAIGHPEDQTILAQAMFRDTLSNEAQMQRLSQAYAKAPIKATFWAQHADEIAAYAIQDVALFYVAAAIYAIYRTERPNLPSLGDILAEPAIAALIQGPFNAAIRVFDDLGDRLIDASTAAPDGATFCLNLFNQPDPRFIRAFLIQAHLDDQPSIELLQAAFEANTEAGRTMVRKVFMGLVRYRMARLPHSLWQQYSIFLTLIKRVLEAGYINMLGDMALGESAMLIDTDKPIAAD